MFKDNLLPLKTLTPDKDNLLPLKTLTPDNVIDQQQIDNITDQVKKKIKPDFHSPISLVPGEIFLSES